MDVLDFLAPEGGKWWAEPLIVVSIKVPAICCGSKVKIKESVFVPPCTACTGASCTHFRGWKSVWDHFGPSGKSLHLLQDGVIDIDATGYFCFKCNAFNEYALPNQIDKYICYNCR